MVGQPVRAARVPSASSSASIGGGCVVELVDHAVERASIFSQSLGRGARRRASTRSTSALTASSIAGSVSRSTSTCSHDSSVDRRRRRVRRSRSRAVAVGVALAPARSGARRGGCRGRGGRAAIVTESTRNGMSSLTIVDDRVRRVPALVAARRRAARDTIARRRRPALRRGRQCASAARGEVLGVERARGRRSRPARSSGGRTRRRRRRRAASARDQRSRRACATLVARVAGGRHAADHTRSSAG